MLSRVDLSVDVRLLSVIRYSNQEASDTKPNEFLALPHSPTQNVPKRQAVQYYVKILSPKQFSKVNTTEDRRYPRHWVESSPNETTRSFEKVNEISTYLLPINNPKPALLFHLRHIPRPQITLPIQRLRRRVLIPPIPPYTSAEPSRTIPPASPPQ